MADFVPDLAEIEAIPWEPGTLALLETLGVEGTAIAKRLCLVDTGTLRESIHHRMTEEGGLPEVQIGSEVPYTLHVEYGEFNTADESPKGAFLRPALLALKI